MVRRTFCKSTHQNCADALCIRLNQLRNKAIKRLMPFRLPNYTRQLDQNRFQTLYIHQGRRVVVLSKQKPSLSLSFKFYTNMCIKSLCSLLTYLYVLLCPRASNSLSVKFGLFMSFKAELKDFYKQRSPETFYNTYYENFVLYFDKEICKKVFAK